MQLQSNLKVREHKIVKKHEIIINMIIESFPEYENSHFIRKLVRF